MHLHILGICGTFMGGLALLARELGHTVTGSDVNVYPPMSTLLESNGVRLQDGYLPEHLQPAPDVVVVGNALSRGNPAVEYMLNAGLPYASGPQWLADHLLCDRWVLAVAGTHGKTTATSMLAWILEFAGLRPGFLIGGVAENFGTCARLGSTPFFVIEADEYDTAFFDKRSKFMHYRPRTAILNNLEFDHADVFADLEAIKTQFHHLIRTIPAEGLLITPVHDTALEDVIRRGCWTPRTEFGDHEQAAAWSVEPATADFSGFEVLHEGRRLGCVTWSLIGRHNAHNALAALAAARHAGVAPQTAIDALGRFQSVKRRLQKLADIDGVSIYDDFAHHPTAIRLTIEALRARVGAARIIAVLEPRSNTMKLGVHKHELAAALRDADEAVLLRPANLAWSLTEATSELNGRRHVFDDVGAIVHHLRGTARMGDHILIMSNGGFDGIYQRLIGALQSRKKAREL
ncbi:MAG: UDP-N-acetylmuramate:L-alanyl-gamma-D-glutamyl-meso-diaminopimelate ligase [Chromatiales bacterium]